MTPFERVLLFHDLILFFFFPSYPNGSTFFFATQPLEAAPVLYWIKLLDFAR